MRNQLLHLQAQKFVHLQNRGVAQLASVSAWGAGGRPFESDHPDDMKIS